MTDAELDALHQFIWQVGTSWFRHELFQPIDSYGGMSLGEQQEWMVIQIILQSIKQGASND